MCFEAGIGFIMVAREADLLFLIALINRAIISHIHREHTQRALHALTVLHGALKSQKANCM